VLEIKDLNTHLKIAKKQSASYQNNKMNIPEDTLIIELDWKQKVLIGLYSLFSFFGCEIQQYFSSSKII